jgi:hypothetical protein
LLRQDQAEGFQFPDISLQKRYQAQIRIGLAAFPRLASPVWQGVHVMVFLDPIRAACLLLEQHGEGARAYALERAGDRQFRNDEAGYAAWMRILEAIGERAEQASGGPQRGLPA